MAGGLESILEHWQYHEELWLRGEPAAKTMIIDALAMVRQSLAILAVWCHGKPVQSYVRC